MLPFFYLKLVANFSLDARSFKTKVIERTVSKIPDVSQKKCNFIFTCNMTQLPNRELNSIASSATISCPCPKDML